MGDIASLNINGTVYGLKDEVARAGSGGGSGYILKCFESGSVSSDNSVFVSSDTGGCIYACGQLTSRTWSKIGSLSIDGISCISDSFVTSREATYTTNVPGGISYTIPFCNNISITGIGSMSVYYSVFKYVKLE